MIKHILSASIVLLSIAIFFFAFQLSNGEMVSREDEEPVQIKESVDNGLLSMEATATYLSMDVEQLKKIIKQQNLERAQLTMYDTYQFIPYIQMNGEKYFSKKQLDEWIDYNIITWQNINY